MTKRTLAWLGVWLIFFSLSPMDPVEAKETLTCIEQIENTHRTLFKEYARAFSSELDPTIQKAFEDYARLYSASKHLSTRESLELASVLLRTLVMSASQEAIDKIIRRKDHIWMTFDQDTKGNWMIHYTFSKKDSLQMGFEDLLSDQESLNITLSLALQNGHLRLSQETQLRNADLEVHRIHSQYNFTEFQLSRVDRIPLESSP